MANHSSSSSSSSSSLNHLSFWCLLLSLMVATTSGGSCSANCRTAYRTWRTSKAGKTCYSSKDLICRMNAKQALTNCKTECQSGITIDPSTPTTLVTSRNGSSTTTCAVNQQCFDFSGPLTFGQLAKITPTLSQLATPWTDTSTNIMTLSAIPCVEGAVPATAISPEGSKISMRVHGKYRYLKGNGLPSTPMGNFPVQAGTSAYPYYSSLPAGMDPATGQPYKPNDTADEIYIAPYDLTSTLPLKPKATGYYPINSLIVGITLTGAVWHAECAADSNGTYYSPTNVLPCDSCFGHPFYNQYHHHGYSWICFPNQGTTGHSPLFGYALDGFGIYGPRDVDGQMITNAQLDKCHGHVGPVKKGGKPRYHYHLNREFPFSVGCFRGEVDYYAALGSIQMRETLLPIYVPTHTVTKWRKKHPA